MMPDLPPERAVPGRVVCRRGSPNSPGEILELLPSARHGRPDLLVRWNNGRVTTCSSWEVNDLDAYIEDLQRRAARFTVARERHTGRREPV